MAAAWWTTAAIPPGNHAPADAPVRDRAARLRHWLHGWLDWRSPLIGLVMLGVELGEGSANSWLTLAVRTDHGQSAAVAALFFTAFAVGAGASPKSSPARLYRLGRTRTVRITTALGVVGMVLFIEAGNRWIVLLGVLLYWAVGVSMGFPLGMSAAAESGPDPAARISVVASIGYFGELRRAAGHRRPGRIGWPAQRAVAGGRPVLGRLRRSRRTPPAPGDLPRRRNRRSGQRTSSPVTVRRRL